MDLFCKRGRSFEEECFSAVYSEYDQDAIVLCKSFNMINNAEISHDFTQLHRSYSLVLFPFLKREKIFQEYSMIVH